MTKILHRIVYLWMYLHALLPFKVLYIYADFFYLVVYKLIRYRVRVVKENLANSFPEKTIKERLAIEKEFYHHFCDYFVETIKLLHISDKEMQQHIAFENTDLLNNLMKDGQSALMYLGHYGNWEWVSSAALSFTQGQRLAYIYRPLKNKAFDRLFLQMRGGYNTISIAKNNTLRAILGMRNTKKHVLVGFLGDQTPSQNNIHYWSFFLNQDTPIFTGVERIAKQTNFPIVFLDVERIKRGYYTATFRLISANPASEPSFAITEKYIRAMEQTILRNPAYWLWTHKRWKWTREEVATTQHEHKPKK